MKVTLTIIGMEEGEIVALKTIVQDKTIIKRVLKDYEQELKQNDSLYVVLNNPYDYEDILYCLEEDGILCTMN